MKKEKEEKAKEEKEKKEKAKKEKEEKEKEKKEKMKILTGENNYQGFSFSCLVYNNNIPISFVQIKEKDATSFTEIKKASSNFYSYDKGDLISYPIILRIISITGEIVNVTISSKESDETYETSGNFYNPDDDISDIPERHSNC